MPALELSTPPRQRLGDRVRALLRRPTAPTAGVATAPTGRDLRLDMFRGLALVMIFINHIPGTVFENWTNRNFGFSDAAEAFVLMSGMAAGLAYSQRFARGPYLAALLKVWARVRQLYMVHITTTVMAIAIFAAAAMWFGHYEVLTKNNLAPLFSRPLAAIVGLPLLTHQLGYFNILPLYAVLLAATPFVMPLALRKPLWLLLGSVALWILAGQYRLNFPNFPNSGGWFFNPFSWQLLFVVGLISGTSMKQGYRFFARKRWAVITSGLILLLVLAWMKVGFVGAGGGWVLGRLSDIGAPFYITWFDKTFVSAPRLIHALALAYFLASLGVIAWLATTPFARPLVLMGRHGLPVFAVGSVLSMVGQAIKAETGANGLIDMALIFGGLGLQLLLAYSLSRAAALQAASSRTHLPAQPASSKGAS